jgi:hypothetical protein
MPNKTPRIASCGVFAIQMPFHPCVHRLSTDSLLSLAQPTPVTMFYDVCGENYDVCGRKTWFGCLTTSENGV